MIARLRYLQDGWEALAVPRRNESDDQPNITLAMSRVTADYDRRVLTLRGTVDTHRERRFVEDAYTALSCRQTVLNLIQVVGESHGPSR